MGAKFILLSWSSCLFSSNSWNDTTNQSQRLKESKHRLGAGHEIRRAKRRKHFTLRKFEERKGKRYRWKAKMYQLTQKCSHGEMQGFVSEIGHHESKRLSEKFASSPKFMWLAMWFNAVLTITFQSFANGTKVSYGNAASEIYSEFIYLCWRLWSPCFSVFC